jgi:hypothetical protein
MEEKKIETKQDMYVFEKKVYTPPSLIFYGSVIDLTAGGSVGLPEQNTGQDKKALP